MELLEGKSIAKQRKAELQKNIQKFKEKSGITPQLRSFLFSEDSASRIYAKQIEKNARDLGIDFQLEFQLEEETSSSLEELREELQSEPVQLEQLRSANEDSNVHGILIHQPLRDSLRFLINEIEPKKDIEGLSACNLGRLFLGEPCFIPPTPLSVMTLLDHYGVEIQGKNVVILGRSSIVGRPLSVILSHRNATVTLCHSKTQNLAKETRKAEILIVAVGKSQFIPKDWVQDSVVVVDVGTNYSSKGLVGDVDFEEVAKKASKITPVPGGVGALTSLLLLENLFQACQDQVLA